MLEILVASSKDRVVIGNDVNKDSRYPVLFLRTTMAKANIPAHY